MTSIRRRLSLSLTLVLTLLLLGQWLWLTLMIDRLIEKQVITRLQEENESLLATVKLDQDGQLQLDSSKLSSVYQRAFSGLYFYVESGQQALFSRSLWDFDFDTVELSPGQQQVQYLNGPQQQPLLAVTATYHKLGREMTITVAEDIAWMLEEKRHFQLVFTVLSATGLLLLLLVQTGIIHQVLKPVRRAHQQLAQLGKGERDHIDADAPEEIKPLLLELNRLMNNMVVKTRRSRQALGNLAHRLKTQLTLLNQLAENESNPAMQRAIQQQTQDIRQIIDRELKRARISGLTLPGREVNIAALLSQLSDTLQRIYQDKSLSINWHLSDDASFSGDQEDFLELLGNLLDNACKWCKQQVSVDIQSENGLKLLVEDDGPGCDAAVLSALTKRGFRADETKPGSGLGLAIVFDIVDSYGGEMRFARSEKLGGLQVTVHLQTKA